MSTLNRYKAYLIQELQRRTENDIEFIINQVGDFVLTDEGKKGFASWSVLQLQNNPPEKKPERLFKQAWDIYDATNPMRSQEDNS